MTTQHVRFERNNATGVLERIETPDDRSGHPTPFDRQLVAERPPAPPVPVETAAEQRAAAVRREHDRAVAVATPTPVQVDPFVHSSSERRGNRLIVTRRRKDGTTATHEVTTPEPTPVPADRGPEALRGPLSYEERLKRVRASVP